MVARGLHPGVVFHEPDARTTSQLADLGTVGESADSRVVVDQVEVGVSSGFVNVPAFMNPTDGCLTTEVFDIRHVA